MTEPILDPAYWRTRLKESNQEHHAIFLCSIEHWKAVETTHRSVLQEVIRPEESVIDVGCGWGRLLSLMPGEWYGEYQGVDLSPDFIAMAEENYPSREFMCMDARKLTRKLIPQKFDWAVLISMEHMFRTNLDSLAWIELRNVIKSVARKLLVLEYDPNERGQIL